MLDAATGEVSWIRKITNFDFEIMAEGMGKLTCPPPQFRFAEEGEKEIMQLTGRQQEILRIVRENGPITGNDRTASPCDEARCVEIWRFFFQEKVIAARRRLGYYYRGRRRSRG
ncbi:MAG: hypothetical protein ACLUIQ_06065 [Dialister invisus]